MPFSIRWSRTALRLFARCSSRPTSVSSQSSGHETCRVLTLAQHACCLAHSSGLAISPGPPVITPCTASSPLQRVRSRTSDSPCRRQTLSRSTTPSIRQHRTAVLRWHRARRGILCPRPDTGLLRHKSLCFTEYNRLGYRVAEKSSLNASEFFSHSLPMLSAKCTKFFCEPLLTISGKPRRGSGTLQDPSCRSSGSSETRHRTFVSAPSSAGSSRPDTGPGPVRRTISIPERPSGDGAKMRRENSGTGYERRDLRRSRPHSPCSDCWQTLIFSGPRRMPSTARQSTASSERTPCRGPAPSFCSQHGSTRWSVRR